MNNEEALDQNIKRLSEIASSVGYSISVLTSILHRQHLALLLAQPRYQDEKRLPQHGFKAYSQNEEDGIIQEIFRRIGTTNRHFIEIGCADGLENNTTYLLLSGWSGLWIDGNPSNIDGVKNKFETFLQSGQLKARSVLVDAENINELVSECLPEPDLFSLDIDGNDYWVWQSLQQIRPRVAIIEYNGTFRPPLPLVAPYDPKFRWDYTAYFGSSLKALEMLGTSKGYKLVGCNLTAANAFFVREDLVGDYFCEPFTAENHFETPRYGLYTNIIDIHKPGVGPYLSLDRL